MDKKIISVCMGSSCFSRGNNESIELIKKYIEEYKCEAEIVLKGNLCLGNCAKGPNLSIGDKEYCGVRSENIYDIMKANFGERVE